MPLNKGIHTVMAAQADLVEERSAASTRAS
jgi:hypothetical protein